MIFIFRVQKTPARFAQAVGLCCYLPIRYAAKSRSLDASLAGCSLRDVLNEDDRRRGGFCQFSQNQRREGPTLDRLRRASRPPQMRKKAEFGEGGKAPDAVSGFRLRSSRRIPKSLSTFLLDIFHAFQPFEVRVLRPERGIVSAGSGKDNTVSQRKF